MFLKNIEKCVFIPSPWENSCRGLRTFLGSLPLHHTVALFSLHGDRHTENINKYIKNDGAKKENHHPNTETLKHRNSTWEKIRHSDVDSNVWKSNVELQKSGGRNENLKLIMVIYYCVIFVPDPNQTTSSLQDSGESFCFKSNGHFL